MGMPQLVLARATCRVGAARVTLAGAAGARVRMRRPDFRKVAPCQASGPPAPFLLLPSGMNATMADRERQLLHQVTTLAQALHQERERLASRLAELELELSVLASKLDGPPALCALGTGARPRACAPASPGPAPTP